MQFIQWDNTFQTGISVIDEQHEKLVGIVNRFGNLITHDTIEKNNFNQICLDLVDYAHYHFDAEERVFSSAGIDPRHVAQHCQQHNELLEHILPLHQLAEVGNFIESRNIFDFLVNWLVFHILGTDMLMAKQISGVHQGQSAEEVYFDVEKNNQELTGKLLVSVKNLLHQIFAKNKELSELNESLDLKVKERTEELSQANDKLIKLANTDSLTELLNRRAFMNEAKHKFDLATRHKRPLSVLMLDVDHFKRVNDTFGHHVGDLVLVKLAEIIKSSLRSTDVIGRIGGEEFAIILPETNLAQTGELTERLLHAVRSTAIETDSPFHITVSIGVATVPPILTNIESVLKEADDALYMAKMEGRDRCCGALLVN